MKKDHTKSSGVITILLSLILCVVLAVVGTGVEVSRVEMGKGFAARAYHIALESLLGEYSLPVFRRYHLFLLDTGFGTGEENEDILLAHMRKDIENTFAPNRNINQWNSLKLKDYNMLGLKLNELSITQKKNILDEDGELFVNEAVGYMKYAVKPEELEKLIQKLSPFSEIKDSVGMVSETLKTEQKMAELDVSMLSFIESVEGLSVKKNSFQFSGNGLLKTEDYFVKSLCQGGISMSNAGVQNTLVWNSLKNKYYNPEQMLSNMEHKWSEIKNYEKKKKDLYEKIEKLQEISADSEETAEGVMRAMEDLYKQIEQVEEREEKAEKSIKTTVIQVEKLLGKVKDKIEEAAGKLPGIEEKQKKAQSAVSDYEEKLNGYKEKGNTELYHKLMQDLNQKKNYANGGITCLSGKGVDVVEEILKGNLQVIEEAEIELDSLNSLSISSEEDITEKKDGIARLNQILSQFDTGSLIFEYGEIAEEKPENPIDSLKTLLKEGILTLVVEDVKSLSKKTLSSENLPSGQCHQL